MTLAQACVLLASLLPQSQTVTLDRSGEVTFERVTEPTVDLDCTNPQIEYRSKEGTLRDTWHRSGQGWVVTRTWDLLLVAPERVRVSFSLAPDPSPAGDFVVPSLVYNANRTGHGNFVRIEDGKREFFREDRAALPAGIVVRTPTKHWALFTDPAPSEELLSSLWVEAKGQSLTHSAIETPWREPGARILSKGSFFPGTGRGPGYTSWFPATRTFRFEKRYYVLAGEAAPDWKPMLDTYRFALEVFADTIAQVTHKERPPKPVLSRARYQYMMAHYQEVGHARGFIRSIRQGLLQRAHYDKMEFGFLDRSMDAVRVAWRRGDRGPALLAVELLLSAPQNGGLFPTTYDPQARSWGVNELYPRNTYYSSYMMGQTLEGLLQFANDVQAERPLSARRYRTWAEDVLTQLIQRQSADGTFCKYWNRAGGCEDPSPVNGAHVVAALARLWAHTPSPFIQEGLTRALDALARVAEKGQFSGDAMDSDCVDKEAGAILLHAFLLGLRSAQLGTPEQRARWQEAALHSAAHLMSWVYLNDVAFGPKAPLSRYAYSTLGGTAVSVAHQHLDFYGAKIAPLFLELARVTPQNHALFESVAALLQRYADQLVALPENNYLGTGESWRLGWQPEQQYQTTWTMLPYGLLGNRRGGFFHSLAWISQLQLGAELDLEELH